MKPEDIISLKASVGQLKLTAISHNYCRWELWVFLHDTVQGQIKIVFELRTVQKLLICSSVVRRPTRQTQVWQQSVGSSVPPCSPRLLARLKCRQRAEVCSVREAAWRLLCTQAGTGTKRWDGLGFHRHRTNCLCFGSCRLRNKFVSDKEPITPCKNSLQSSKIYWSPGISVVENKKFEGFCSKSQESK